MTTDYLGIDIGKEKLDVVLLKGEKSFYQVFPNQAKGFVALHNWLKKKQITELHTAMEASGSYWEKLAEYLFKAGYRVSVINPMQIHNFAKCELTRTKTDRVDAGVIARYCKSQTPYPWKPLPAHKRELRNMTRRRNALKDLCQQELNHLWEPEISELEKKSINTVLATLKSELKVIEERIKEHINNYSDLKEQAKLLTSISGIADVTAGVILSEIGELSNYRSARQLAAYAGLTPRQRQSGSSVQVDQGWQKPAIPD